MHSLDIPGQVSYSGTYVFARQKAINLYRARRAGLIRKELVRVCLRPWLRPFAGLDRPLLDKDGPCRASPYPLACAAGSPHKAFCLGTLTAAKPRHVGSLTGQPDLASSSSKITNAFERTCRPRPRCSKGTEQACLEADEAAPHQARDRQEKSLGMVER